MRDSSEVTSPARRTEEVGVRMAGWGPSPGPYNVQLQVVPEAGGTVHSYQHSAPLVGAEAYGQAVHPRAGPVIGRPRIGDERSPLPKDVCGPSCGEKKTGRRKCQQVGGAAWGPEDTRVRVLGLQLRGPQKPSVL